MFNNNGWIKLHRKIIDNQELIRSNGAFKLFIVLLCIANDSGKWSGGRFQLAKIAHLKNSNTYKALISLQKLKIVTLSSNNRYTEIGIINWAKYQQKEKTVTLSSNNGVTTEGQRSNTLYKNKNIRNKNIYNIAATAAQNKNMGLLEGYKLPSERNDNPVYRENEVLKKRPPKYHWQEVCLEIAEHLKDKEKGLAFALWRVGGSPMVEKVARELKAGEVSNLSAYIKKLLKK